MMNQGDPSVLRCNHIQKSFDTDSDQNKLEILTDINVSIKPKEICAIVGSSGCGKSTLLHIMGGLDKPTSGEVWWNDEPIHKYKTEDLADLRNRNIGFVFQFHHLLAEFTAIENVMMPAFIKGESQKVAYNKASNLLNRFGLGQRLEHRPSQLSGGEQQRVSMARALMNNPSMILADEPTGNLDEKNTELILSLLFELREEEGISIVLITHEKEIADRCNTVYSLHNGILEKAE
ncbi:MAG: ABC transporter ATP-binding protein [Balneolaceae bacterium]